MKASPALALVAVLAACAWGCSSDACQNEPASFQLDVLAGPLLATDIESIDVQVVVGPSGWRQTFVAGDRLADGETSIAILIEPAPSDNFDLQVQVVGKGIGGVEIASGRSSVRATPNGCNRVEVRLTEPGLVDAGVDGGARDADPIDVAPTDAPPTDAPPPDAPPGDGPVDGGPDLDAMIADAPDDAGSDPDAGSPDAIVVSFPYGPSNFEPALLQPIVGLDIDCGEVVFDSSSLTFDRSCGGRAMPLAVIENQTNGPDIAIIPVTSLGVASGSELRLRGSRAVVLAVFGDVRIDGTIDASSEGATPGAGGSPIGECFGQSGEEGGFVFAGGGGGGALGSDGGRGGNSGITGIGGSGGNGNVSDLTPLRGGCAGGEGGTNSGGARGAGGGAVQISAAGTLTLSNSGRLLAGGGGGEGGDRRAGGGGGGSGGGVLLEADDLLIGGTLYANGGGGGGGGPESNAASGVDGQSGGQADPTGGQGGGQGEGGEGGDGANEIRAVGLDGGDGASGGGSNAAGGAGGGGGLGVVQLRGESSCLNNGTSSPLPSGC